MNPHNPYATHSNPVSVQRRLAFDEGWAACLAALVSPEAVEAGAAAGIVSKGGECDTGMGSCGGTHTDCYYRGVVSDILAGVVAALNTRSTE